MAKASKDMEKLGIEILSCNIQNVTDENGLINDLGMDNTSKIKKDAQIARAEADRDVAIAKAEADRAANDARVAAETEIAKKNNELAIKQAELKLESDRKQAMADAAYEIQKQEQQKSIQTATVNAQIARAEREAELKQKDDQIRKEKVRLKVYAGKAKEKLQKKNEQIKVLKKALETERSIRMKSLLESKTISEASLYMDQLLEDTRRATAQYQKIVEMLAKEAKKHE
jgi:flotillin